jgi:hypothetical protein
MRGSRVYAMKIDDMKDLCCEKSPSGFYCSKPLNHGGTHSAQGLDNRCIVKWQHQGSEQAGTGHRMFNNSW